MRRSREALAQRSLFDPDDYAYARRTDPETSHEAAESVEHIRESQQRVLHILAMGPACDEEIAKQYAHLQLPLISPSGLRTRRAELVAKGLVRDSGQRKETRAGRKTIVWELVA